MTVVNLRRATLADAVHLAMLVDMAGKGMPVRVWQDLAAPGQSPLEVGRARAMREEANFSYRNATVAERGGEVLGVLVGYLIAPDDTDLATLPPPFRPILELEREAIGRWYVYVLAVYPEARGVGVGSLLLREADRLGAAQRPTVWRSSWTRRTRGRAVSMSGTAIASSATGRSFPCRASSRASAGFS